MSPVNASRRGLSRLRSSTLCIQFRFIFTITCGRGEYRQGESQNSGGVGTGTRQSRSGLSLADFSLHLCPLRVCRCQLKRGLTSGPRTRQTLLSFRHFWKVISGMAVAHIGRCGNLKPLGVLLRLLNHDLEKVLREPLFLLPHNSGKGTEVQYNG